MGTVLPRSDIYHTIKMLIKKRQIDLHNDVTHANRGTSLSASALGTAVFNFLNLEWTEHTNALKQLTCITSIEVPMGIIIHCGPMMDNTPTLSTDTIQAGSLATLSVYTAEKDVGAGCPSVYFSLSANCLKC